MKIKMYMIQGEEPRPNIEIQKSWPEYKKVQFERVNEENRGRKDRVYARMDSSSAYISFRAMRGGDIHLFVTSDENNAKEVLSRKCTKGITNVHLVETHIELPEWKEAPHADQAAVNQV